MYAKLFLVCCTSARFKLWVEAKWGRVINKLSDLRGCETPGWFWSSAGGSNERRRTNMLGHRHQGFWQLICDTFLRYRSFPDYVSLKDTLSRRLWTLACLMPPARGLGLAQKGWRGRVRVIYGGREKKEEQKFRDLLLQLSLPVREGWGWLIEATSAQDSSEQSCLWHDGTSLANGGRFLFSQSGGEELQQCRKGGRWAEMKLIGCLSKCEDISLGNGWSKTF